MIVFDVSLQTSTTPQHANLATQPPLACSPLFVKFEGILSHPFDEIFDQYVLVKTVDHQPHIRVAMRKYLDKMRHNHKRVGAHVLGVQLFHCEGAFAGSHIDRVVKMKQEHFETFLGGELSRSDP
jgi:hypothetical protein